MSHNVVKRPRTMHKSISLVFIILGAVSAPSIALAHNIVINCHKIQKYSHSQVHFGLSMIGNRVAHSEKNYLHEKYHHLSQSCQSNHAAKIHVKASPQLVSMMSEYGFLD